MLCLLPISADVSLTTLKLSRPKCGGVCGDGVVELEVEVIVGTRGCITTIERKGMSLQGKNINK